VRDQRDDPNLSDHLKRIWDAMAELDREVERLREGGDRPARERNQESVRPERRNRHRHTA
jgi:hypothetical protein